LAGLGPSKFAQKLAGGGIFGARGGLEVECFGVLLHGRGLVLDPVEAEILDQPDGAARVVARDAFAADQRDDLAEAGAVQLDQALTVGVLLGRHFVEHGGAVGIVGAQAFGIAAVDAGVIFLGGDGQCQHLLFGQVAEPAAVEPEPFKSHEMVPFALAVRPMAGRTG
jgi:hypothetical protein